MGSTRLNDQQMAFFDTFGFRDYWLTALIRLLTSLKPSGLPTVADTTAVLSGIIG